jgi:hypothetical protein
MDIRPVIIRAKTALLSLFWAFFIMEYGELPKNNDMPKFKRFKGDFDENTEN